LKFKVLSHAGLAVDCQGTQLVCDPWLVGSTYWRSWWNYPPVAASTVRSLKPDFVYLTHIHWDHFQGPSLRKFDPETTILVPDGHDSRMREDLHQMRFPNVVELAHGESFELAPGFKLTGYHFGFIPTDSALVIEGDGTTLLNANDTKLMGRPLAQVLDRHPRIDFVFRSHSSANSRLCYEITDDSERSVDDVDRYVQSFTAFVCRTGARHAIPFASNHCFLHDETYPFNDTVQTPAVVEAHFEHHKTSDTELQVMVSGDSWSSEEGFEIAEHDYFERRSEHIEQYRLRKKPVLEKFYLKEARATIRDQHMSRYFADFFRALPAPFRLLYRKKPILFVLSAGESRTLYEVDIYRRSVERLESYSDADYPMQIHTGTLVMKHCVTSRLLSHLPISKRVRYRTTARLERRLKLFNRLINLYEYNVFAIRKLPLRRLLRIARLRWREGLLYAEIAKDLAFRRGFREQRYLTSPHSGAST
jgi:UDP-MurNAc hydroxylase